MFKKLAHGFTLVELLISAAILTFVLCGILITYSSCITLVKTSKNINSATNAAQAKIEEIRAYSFDDIVADYNSETYAVDDIPGSVLVIYADDANTELLKVTISVCWRQGNRVIGEDIDLDGVLDAGEDANGNGIIDSAVTLVTLITRPTA